LFTGIVESTGRIESLTTPATPRTATRSATAPLTASATTSAPTSPPGPRPPTMRISISSKIDLATVPAGGSIAVDGVCLTVTGRRGRRFDADLGPETLALTTLGQLQPGDQVHLERPLRMGDPLGGHLVAGHVDGVGKVVATRPLGEALELEIAAPAALAPFLAAKGSIAIDGVSLTLNRVTARSFSVTLIPHTLAVTCLGQLRPGDKVNLEADLLAKHVARLLETRLPVRARAPRATSQRRSRRHV
jgi:riboflavin synthase